MKTPPDLVADRYRLVKMIGSGGMGVVWHAWDERLQRTVALKMLRTQPELTDEEREVTTKRAMREARISAGLHHPHAVPVFDVIEHEGQPCIVMQLIDSTPLSTLLQEHGTFTPRQTARVGAEVGSALAAAHRRKIVHRDVKPGNILIREDGSAMISDFGIAQALGDTTITATGLVHGTPAYLAPEVARGEPSSFASDVFSLGSTMFAMLEGTPPFGTDQNAIALLHRVARGEVAVPTSAGPLAPLLHEMLASDPKQRPDMSTVTRRLTDLDEQAATTDAAGPADGEDTLPSTLPLAGGAAAAAAAASGATAAAAAHEPPTMPADTRAIGDTAETESLTDDAEADSPAEAAETASLADADEEAAETESLAEAEAPTTPQPTGPASPLFPWMAETQPATPQEQPAPEPEAQPRRRRTAALVGGALVALALLVVGGILLFNGLRQDGGVAAGPEAEETPTSEPAESEAPPAESAPAEEPTEEPAPPPAETEAPPSAEQRAADMLVDYYALVPGDLDSAWSLMTEDYQVNHVGGRDAYEAFWGEITDVAIADVTATGTDAQATLTYTFDDGRVVREVTAYRLVDEGGVLKIAASEVLSSTQL
ncbi:protein kinase domain-containing protein [Agromyces sp. ZXT2-6]|uniref:protein kinase domain-containing protein n=1 Tax=Agromyces sp. ZXT2-6 TaxID=3461153 RepID=UPI004054F742